MIELLKKDNKENLPFTVYTVVFLWESGAGVWKCSLAREYVPIVMGIFTFSAQQVPDTEALNCQGNKC